MYTLGTLGVVYNPAYPAWSQWQPGSGSRLNPIDPYDIPDEILDRWQITSPGQRGWYQTGHDSAGPVG